MVRLALLAPIVAGALAACGPITGDSAGTGTAADRSTSGDPNAGLDLSVHPPSSAPAPALPATVDSADGRRVTVRDTTRILPLQGHLNEAVFALGLGDRVVGRDVSATFTEAAELPVVTRAHDVSVESVLSLRPTVVLADTTTGPPQALEQIRAVGVPVVVFEAPTTVAAVGSRLVAVAEALGVADTGRALANRVSAELAAVAAADDTGHRPRVAFLYLRGHAGVFLIGGPASGADSMIAAAGGTDAGTAIGIDRPFTPITTEALIDAAPDAVLVTTTGLDSVGGLDGLLQMPGIAQTPAGRDRRVVALEDGLLFGFGPRTPAAVRELATQLAQATQESAATAATESTIVDTDRPT